MSAFDDIVSKSAIGDKGEYQRLATFENVSDRRHGSSSTSCVIWIAGSWWFGTGRGLIAAVQSGTLYANSKDACGSNFLRLVLFVPIGEKGWAQHRECMGLVDLRYSSTPTPGTIFSSTRVDLVGKRCRANRPDGPGENHVRDARLHRSVP